MTNTEQHSVKALFGHHKPIKNSNYHIQDLKDNGRPLSFEEFITASKRRIAESKKRYVRANEDYHAKI